MDGMNGYKLKSNSLDDAKNNSISHVLLRMWALRERPSIRIHTWNIISGDDGSLTEFP